MVLYHVTNQNELYHHGVKGQKWGVRKYQNPDGSLTALGMKRANAKRNAHTMNDVNSIADSMSITDKKRLGLLANEKYQESVKEGEWIAKRILLRDDNTYSRRLAERHGFMHHPSLDYTNDNGHYKTYIKTKN